ncbi:MAG: YqaA family protein [Marinifilaceae bacterium]
MEWLTQLGYFGLFIGSFLASTVVPFSADVLLVAILALGGNIWVCLLVATAGNWLGGLTSYWIGWLGKWKWIEKWFRVKQEQLEKQKKHIDKYGSLLAFMTWLPLVGDLFAIALGFYRVSPRLSALYMLLGRFFRFAVWTLLYILYADKFTALFN